MTVLDNISREARERGMRDFERGTERTACPFPRNSATDERGCWLEGWDNAKSLKQQDDAHDAKKVGQLTHDLWREGSRLNALLLWPPSSMPKREEFDSNDVYLLACRQALDRHMLDIIERGRRVA